MNDEKEFLLKPYIAEVDRLTKLLKEKEMEVEKASTEFCAFFHIYCILTTNHEKSGLERDIPQVAIWKRDEEDGGMLYTCPKCGGILSIGQPYCGGCGQRVIQDNKQGGNG